MKIDSISCPNDGNVLSYFGPIYPNVFVVLHPFIRTVGISPDVFYPDTYPTKTEILRTCQSVPWSEIARLSELESLRQIDIGLRSRIRGLNKDLQRDDWAKLLDEMPGLICPSEGCLSPFTENRLLASLRKFGYTNVMVRDEQRSITSVREIRDLESCEDIPYAGSIFTEDEQIYATTHWDSHFSFLCSKERELLARIIEQDGFEGFFCD